MTISLVRTDPPGWNLGAFGLLQSTDTTPIVINACD